MAGAADERGLQSAPVWHVSEPRCPWFVGRESTLLALREQLLADQVVAITESHSDFARGGMGKTTTAREYVQQHRGQYKHVIWLQAYSEFDLRADLMVLAERLGWPGRQDTSRFDILSAMRRWLARESNWLLVLDEVRQAELAAQLIPDSHSGHVLITSRRGDLRALGAEQPIRLSPFSEREAVDFLIKRTGRDAGDSLEAEGARQLADELGYFPLALELASAYIATHFCRFQDYLNSYRSRRQQEHDLGKSEARDYSAEVGVPLAMLREAVVETSPAAAELLTLCAALRPTSIPLEILSADTTVYPQNLSRGLAASNGDPLRRDRLLEPLVRLGLVRRELSEQTLQMHRVVQTMVWDGLDLQEQRIVAQRQAEIFENLWERTFAAESVDARRRVCERLFPQTMTVAKLQTAWSLMTPTAAQLLQHVADEFIVRDQLKEAAAWYREVVHVIRQIGGQNHADLIGVFARLADLYEQLGDRERALARLDRALGVLVASRPSDDPETVALRARIALLSATVGRYAQAAEQWEQILTAREGHLDSLHTEVLEARENLADLYCSLHKPAHAELLVVRQLALLQQRTPERTSDINRTRLLLARVFHSLGKLVEAERLLLPMIAPPLAADSQGKLQHADVLNRLALVMSARGQFATAEEMLRQALMIRRKQLSPTDPIIAVTYNDLGEACFRQQKLQQARELFSDAIEIQEPLLARNDPQLIRTRNNLAALLATLGDHAKSEDLFLQDLQFKRQSLGADHPHVATTLNNLGVIYGMLHREADEEQMFREALAIRENAFGAVHPQVAQSLSQLASVWSRQGRYAAAKNYLQRALNIRREILVAEHPDLAWTMNNLAEISLLQEVRGRAEELLEPAVEMLEKSLPAEHPQLAAVVANLGEAHRLSEQTDKAEMYLQRALTVLDQPNRNSTALVRCLTSIGLLERDRGRFDQATQALIRAAVVQSQLASSTPFEIARLLRHQSEVALAREQFAQAEPQLLQALEILKTTPTHPERIACGALLTSLRVALEDRRTGAELLAETLASARDLLSQSVEPAVLKWLHPLAEAAFALVQLNVAEEVWMQQVELSEQILGATHPELSAPLKGLAKLYYSQQRLSDAEPLLVRCLAIDEAFRDINHPEVARTVENLAGLYFLQNQFEQAEPLIQRALAYKERAFGRRHAKVADALENYAALLRKTNRPEKAEEYENRASNIRLKHEHILGDLF